MNPIKNDAEYESACSEVEKLFDIDPGPDHKDYDRFVELCKLISDYDDIHYPLADL